MMIILITQYSLNIDKTIQAAMNKFDHFLVFNLNSAAWFLICYFKNQTLHEDHKPY